MNKAKKQILISFLFLSALGLSFYFIYATLFLEVNFISFIILFLISLFFSSAFFVLLIFTFSARILLGEEKKKDKEIIQEINSARGETAKRDKPFKKKEPFNWKLIIVHLLSAILFFLLFYFLVSPKKILFLIAGSIFIFLLFYIGGNFITNEKKLFLKFNFYKISRGGLSQFLTAISVLMAISMFLSPKIVGGQIGLPRQLFDVAMPVAENLFSENLPGFSGELTVDEFLILQIISQFPDGDFENQEIDLDEFQNRGDNEKYQTQQIIPFFPGEDSSEKEERDSKNKLYDDKEIAKKIKKAKKEIPKEMIVKMRVELGESLETKLKGDEKVKDVLYNFASSQASDFLKKNKEIEQIGEWGIILILFMYAKGILFFFSYIALPFSMLMFFIFKKIGFFKIENIKVDKEELAI